MRIEYASPGYIDLGVVLSIALALSGIVRHVCKSIDTVNSTYNGIQTGLRERKLGGIKAQRFSWRVRSKNSWMSPSTVSLRPSACEKKTRQRQIKRLTPNSLVALKSVLSMYRRIRVLAKLQDQKKIEF